ncbi:MAG: S1C family serine protease [Rhodospirillaceae bacterium]
MSEINVPNIDPKLHPNPSAFGFDLERALSSVVSLHSRVPDEAYTAGVLGTERAGHGVVIGDDGLVLTIGYLVVEAETIWLLDSNGAAVPGHVAGYDHETGFGLVQALGRLAAPSLPLGSARDVAVGDQVVFAGYGGREGAIATRVEEKREFAGYWEYLLEEAIFTAPAHPFWGGGALIGPGGTLCGIGSLYVQQNAEGGQNYDGNMIVPIDLLPPILGDLQRFGKPQRAARPWIGALTAEADGRVVVVGLWDNGPADSAGLQPGDLIVGVDKRPVSTLPELFRAMWGLGTAGVDVPLNVLRAGQLAEIHVASGNRADFYTTPKVH